MKENRKMQLTFHPIEESTKLKHETLALVYSEKEGYTMGVWWSDAKKWMDYGSLCYEGWEIKDITEFAIITEPTIEEE